MKKYKSNLVNESFDYTVSAVNHFKPLYKNINFRPFIYQLKRSVSSISSNIEEAQFSKSEKEFAWYYKIALKSGSETKHWLRLLSATMPEHTENINKFMPKVQELTKILAASIISLRKDK